MPVYKIAQEMTYEEFLGWLDYFEKRPPEWRADDRAYKYLQTQGVKEKPWSIFASLNAIYNSKKAPVQDGMVDASSFKSSLMFSKMMGAVNGDKLSL
jgi:hypothetical protein